MNLAELDDLSTAEKLTAMERLWSGLHREIEHQEPPAWHKRILDERKQLIESGQAEYVPWAVAKRQLADRTK